MLKNSLYTIIDLKKAGSEENSALSQEYVARILLNADHDIFKGHFPGNPVLPGVCQVEMAREIMEIITAEKLMLTNSSQVKYLSLVSPLEHPELELSLKFAGNQEGYDVSTGLVSGESVFMKMKCRLTIMKHA